MKTKFLLPHRFKLVGWCLLVPALICGAVILLMSPTIEFLKLPVFAVYDDPVIGPKTVFGLSENNIFDELVSLAFIIGAMFVAFSREPVEDEFIAKLRLESLLWATYLNYAILAFCILFFYGTGFFTVMIFNMFTLLIFFLIRFQFMLYRNKKTAAYEEPA